MEPGKKCLAAKTVLLEMRTFLDCCKGRYILRSTYEIHFPTFHCHSATMSCTYTDDRVVSPTSRTMDRRMQFSGASMLLAIPVLANVPNHLRPPIHNLGTRNRQILSNPSQLPYQGTYYSADTLHFAAFGSLAVSASLGSGSSVHLI